MSELHIYTAYKVIYLEISNKTVEHACSPFIMFYSVFRIGIQHALIFVIIDA